MKNYVWTVHACPNLEEDYIIFVSESKIDCVVFLSKHKKYYYYNHLYLKKYKLNHWYREV